MGQLSNLQTLLESILGSGNVYFQPPPSISMQYPCIVFARSYMDTQFADNIPYRGDTRYSVTLIDRDPDSSVLAKIKNLPMCIFDRHFTANDLNHDVFSIYY